MNTQINLKELIDNAKKNGEKLLVISQLKDSKPVMASTEPVSELATAIGDAVSVVAEVMHVGSKGKFTFDEVIDAIMVAASARARNNLAKTLECGLTIRAR